MWLAGVICVVSWFAAGWLLLRDYRLSSRQESKKFFEKMADGILSYPAAERFYHEPVKRILLQLHPTKEAGELCRIFYRDKLMLILKIWFAGIHLIAALAVIEPLQSVLSEGNSVQRGPYGESEEVLLLEVRTDNEITEEISYDIYAQKYKPEEVEAFVEQFREECEILIRSENENLQEVKTDLNLLESYDLFPMQFSWESSDYSLVDEEGNVKNENLTDAKIVNLKAVMVYDEMEFEYEFSVRICPREQTEEELWRNEILTAIQEADEKHKHSDKLLLPSEIAGKKVFYTVAQETSVPLYLLFLFVIVVLLYLAGDNDLKKEAERRKRNLSLKYPEFVSKFQLLLGAGMTVRNIFWRLSEDTSLGEDLRQELNLLVRDMKNGLSVKEALDKFGRRCAHPLYMKFSALLAQNLKKGTGDLLEQLSGEAVEAFTLRKTHARQLGEEAGTKLLGPMILMLAIVMAVLMIPAFLSFQL